jgi:hypothetical protein
VSGREVVRALAKQLAVAQTAVSASAWRSSIA